jgi:hypothetical protein
MSKRPAFQPEPLFTGKVSCLIRSFPDMPSMAQTKSGNVPTEDKEVAAMAPAYVDVNLLLVHAPSIP